MTSEHFKEAMGTASDLSNLAGAIQRNTQTQLLREQNSLLRAQEAEQQRLAALPKCPECMQPVLDIVLGTLSLSRLPALQRASLRPRVGA